MPPARSLTLLFTVPGILSPPCPLPLSVAHSPTWTTQLSLPSDTLSLTIVFSTALTVLVLLLSASPMRMWAPRWSSNFSMLFPALSPHTARLVGVVCWALRRVLGLQKWTRHTEPLASGDSQGPLVGAYGTQTGDT